MKQPMVSVVLPVYNSRRYIADAVASILAQTFDDFEFIIVDDGSSDGTAAILREFAAADPRIVLITQQNMGVSAASNRGLAIARGEFLARMDHDDIAFPQRFELQVEFLRSHPECVGVGGQVTMIDDNGEAIRNPKVPCNHEEIENAISRSWSIFHPTLMARLETVRTVGGYSLKYSNMEDMDLFMKLAEHGRLANLPDVVLQYRQHHQSMCYTRTREQVVQIKSLLLEAAKRRGRAIASPAMDRNPSPHPPPRRQTLWSYEKMWAWWALDDGYVSTARRHAIRALRLAPLRPESWLLLLCSLRGH